MKHLQIQEELTERVALYALGALTQHEVRSFDEHLSDGCEICRSEVDAFQSVVFQLGLAADEEAPPAEARVRLVQSLPEVEPVEDKTAQSLTVRVNEGEWHQIAEGIFEKVLFKSESKGAVTSLYKFLPGARCPGHRHLGVEECLVLEGDFHVNGEVFGPGDYRCMPQGSLDDDLYSVAGATLLIMAPENAYEPLPPD